MNQISIFLALLFLPCTAPAASSEGKGAPLLPFRSGETLIFKIHWMGTSVGRTSLSVAGPIPWKGKRVFRFQAQTLTIGWLNRVYPVNDIAESHVDARGLFSYRFELRQREGRYRSHKWYTFEGRRATYVRATRPPRYYETPGEVQDALSAFYRVRSLRLRTGETVEVPVFDSKKNWRVKVNVLRRERVKSPWGGIATLLIEPEIKSDSFFRSRGKVRLWVTEDRLHVPVRLEGRSVIGPFAAHLIETRGLPFGPLAGPPLKMSGEVRPGVRSHNKIVFPAKQAWKGILGK